MKQSYYSTVTSKGQTTVPLAVRELLEIRKGDKLRYVVDGDVIRIDAINLDLESIIGSIKPRPGADLSDWDKVREEAWAEATARLFTTPDSK